MDKSPKPNHASNETKHKILCAAELLFIKKGFSATSLRSVAVEAKVNLAATHYHFGSKEGLFAATVHRHIRPITEKRIQALEALLCSDQIVSVKSIMAAFLSPLRDGSVSESLPKLMGRVYGEPEFITRPLLEQEFGSTTSRFIEALQLALPDVELIDLQWRFHFTVGSMIQLLNFDRPHDNPLASATGGRQVAPEEGFDRLLSFITAGITQ
jgi:AcrR family transcriptional regulator